MIKILPLRQFCLALSSCILPALTLTDIYRRFSRDIIDKRHKNDKR
jgi:hypothetical protein